MKIYKFDELNLFEKPCVIKIVGPGYSNKNILARNLLISFYDKTYLNLNSNMISHITDKINQFTLTIFTNDNINYFPSHMKNYTINFITSDKFVNFYLLRKYHIKKNPNISIHILLIDYNLSCKRNKDKYFQKLIDDYKKLNLIIIFYEYYLSFDYKEANYILAVHDGFESFIESTYEYMIDENYYNYNQYKHIFNKITIGEGVMVLKKGKNKKLYKLQKLYNKKKELDKIKMNDKKYDPLSDESNILFF